MDEQQTTAGGTREYDVLLRLCLVDVISDDALATLAEHILESVNTYAASCVDGAAIGYRLEPPEVHLDFTTDAENLAEVERVIERVNEIIVGETPMKFELARLCPAGVSL
jgi:hypothetical protein